MIKAGGVTKGMYLNWRGEPVLVLDKEFCNLGRGAAIVRFKLKGLKSGNIIKETFKTDNLLEEVSVEQCSAQFLYKSGDNFVFMNPHDYQQHEVKASLIDEKGFIREGNTYQLVIYQGRVIGVKLPKKMSFKIVKTERSIKGNTVTGASKPAVLDTGLTIKVPLFIKKEETIIVNTETKEYVSRKS